LEAIEIQEGKHKTMLTSEEIHKLIHSHKIKTAATEDAAETI
jgi:hypothetical protein